MTCGVQRGDLEACTDLSSASCEFRTDGYGGMGNAIGGPSPSPVGDRAMSSMCWARGGVLFPFPWSSSGFLSVCGSYVQRRDSLGVVAMLRLGYGVRKGGGRDIHPGMFLSRCRRVTYSS